MRELFCEAPAPGRPRDRCGQFIGEEDHDVRLMVISRARADYELLYPPPRIVKTCKRCRWYSIYDPLEAEARRLARARPGRNIAS